MKKNKKTVVVGVNTGHDGGAAVIVDGIIKCAISEERLNRRKHSPGYINSVFYCLNALKLKLDDVSLFAFSAYGERLPKRYSGDLACLNLPNKRFITVDHHLSHAYGAYCLSPFEDALVLVIDGQGNGNDTESYYVADSERIDQIGGNLSGRNPAKGIGRTYEAFTNFLGWADYDAGKTMAIASYGNSDEISIPLFKFNNFYHIESALEYKYEKGVIEFAKKYSLNFGIPYIKKLTPDSIRTAAYVQSHTERTIIELVKRLAAHTGRKRLCMAGGVALNCAINGKLLSQHIVDDIFISPAPSDTGQAIGNALYGFHYLTGHMPRNEIKNSYFGRSYTEDEILMVLRKYCNGNVRKEIPKVSFTYEKQASITKSVADLLAKGNLICWYQGGSELGPRALGNRSILSGPSNLDAKHILNTRVKHRDNFHPFAPSCLFEKVHTYFEVKKETPYMSFAVPARKDNSHKISAVIHVDNTARLQSVSKKNGLFYGLIKEYEDITGIPILLNTSFNRREPIVETPKDAISTFLSSPIDFLAIGDYLAYNKK